MWEGAIANTKTETSQLLAKARSCASRDLSLGGRHPCMMRSAWERVNAGPLPLQRLGHRFGWRDRARLERGHAWTQRHHLPQNRSRWLRLRLNGFAGVHIGTRVLACFFIVIICQQVTHFIVTWRQHYRIIKRDLMRYGRQFCSDGAATARTKQNTAIVHVHSLPDTRLWVLGHPAVPIRCETYSHRCCVHRRHALSNPGSSVSKNGTSDTVADIDCTVDRVANPSTHIFWMPGYATRC